MFRNRAVQVSMVKKNQQTEGPRLDGRVDIEKVNEMIKDQVQNTAVVVGGAYVAKKAVDTLAELVLITGRRYL